MFDKPIATHSIGLDIDDFSFKGAALGYSRNKIVVDELFDFITESAKDEDGNVKLLYTEDQKAQLSALADTHLLVTAAATEDVLVRPLEMTLKKDKDIEAALPFQVEPILPYPAENAIVDKIIFSKDKEGSKLSVIVLRKDHLAKHLERWKQDDVEPEIVSAAPQALAIFTDTYFPQEDPLYVLHLGIANSFCILVDKGKLIAAQSVPGGIKEMLDAYAQAIGGDAKTAYQQLVMEQEPLSEELMAAPAFKAAIDAIRLNATRTIYALAKQFKNREIDNLLVTGPGAVADRLADILTTALNKKPVSRDTPDEGFDVSRTDLLNYALPIGQALSALPARKDQVNFRQQEYAYPEPWKRLKKPIMQYFVLFIGIAIALMLFGKAYVIHQEGQVKRQYLDLLDVMNKPYTTFEKEVGGKVAHESTRPEGEATPIDDLSLNGIQSRLNILEKEIQSTPQIFPLQPNIPLVSDVLAWITSHPLVAGKQAETDEGGFGGGLQIQNFSYTMVKRPEPTKKQERYQVKVELEFTSPTPKLARELHDALIAPNDIVDPKGEVKWNSNRDVYRTSFYLKDKTIYPSS